MRWLLPLYLAIFSYVNVVNGSQTKLMATTGDPADMHTQKIVFATYAQDDEALGWILVMIESLRAFGGNLHDAPLWVYLPGDQPEMEKAVGRKQIPTDVSFGRSNTPKEADAFPFAGKVFASALAEAEMVGQYQLLVWLDPDVIFVNEPREFLLPDSVSFGYRPVMHKLIGSSFSEPPDEFWLRVYDKLGVAAASIFPVKTPVDREMIRAYFNAGMLILRPEMGVLRRWPICFATLYADSVFVKWCEQDKLKAVFLHQVALAGAVLSTLRREDTIELSETYNYSIYLRDRYLPEKRPASLDDVVMFRHEFVFSESGGFDTVEDSSKILQWLKERLPNRK